MFPHLAMQRSSLRPVVVRMLQFLPTWATIISRATLYTAYFSIGARLWAFCPTITSSIFWNKLLEAVMLSRTWQEYQEAKSSFVNVSWVRVQALQVLLVSAAWYRLVFLQLLCPEIMTQILGILPQLFGYEYLLYTPLPAETDDLKSSEIMWDREEAREENKVTPGEKLLQLLRSLGSSGKSWEHSVQVQLTIPHSAARVSRPLSGVALLPNKFSPLSGWQDINACPYSGSCSRKRNLLVCLSVCHERANRFTAGKWKRIGIIKWQRLFQVFQRIIFRKSDCPPLTLPLYILAIFLVMWSCNSSLNKFRNRLLSSFFHQLLSKICNIIKILQLLGLDNVIARLSQVHLPSLPLIPRSASFVISFLLRLCLTSLFIHSFRFP